MHARLSSTFVTVTISITLSRAANSNYRDFLPIHLACTVIIFWIDVEAAVNELFAHEKILSKEYHVL